MRVRRSDDGGPTDAALAMAVLALLRGEGWTDPRVRIEEGKVTIAGQLHSAAARDAAAAAVATVSGVSGVWLTDEPSQPAGAAMPHIPRIRTTWQ